MPIGSPIATTEPKATSRITIAATRPRISPIPVSASANAKNRSPRISTRNGESAAAVAPYASIRCRSEGSSRSTTGYCTSITATLPSGDSCGSAGADHVRQRGRPGTHGGQGGRGIGGGERGAGILRRQHELHGQPGSRRCRRGEQLGCLVGVRAGHREGVLELLPDGAAGREHDHHQQQPGADDLPRMARGQSAPAIESVRQHGDSLEDPRYAGRSPTCPSSRAAGVATSALGLVPTRPIDRLRGRLFGRCRSPWLH